MDDDQVVHDAHRRQSDSVSTGRGGRENNPNTANVGCMRYGGWSVGFPPELLAPELSGGSNTLGSRGGLGL